MRRKDREMDREFALAVTDKCEYATLAMAAKEGEPYCIPVTIARDGEKIYFHCAKVGTKVDMMRENPRVCMTCVGDTRRVPEEFTTKFESAVIRGRASEVTDDETKIHALRLICQRHAAAGMDGFDDAIKRSLGRTAIWQIDIEDITGKCKK